MSVCYTIPMDSTVNIMMFLFIAAGFASTVLVSARTGITSYSWWRVKDTHLKFNKSRVLEFVVTNLFVYLAILMLSIEATQDVPGSLLYSAMMLFPIGYTLVYWRLYDRVD